jgi:hypothetical protein
MPNRADGNAISRLQSCGGLKVDVIFQRSRDGGQATIPSSLCKFLEANNDDMNHATKASMLQLFESSILELCF